MQSLVVSVDLPRKEKTDVIHKAHVVLQGNTIEDIADQLVDLQKDQQNIEIITGLPASLVS